MARPRWTGREAEFLRQALKLAARSDGRTSPNPMVGAVLVRAGRVIGRGFHARAGAPHAEIVALQQAGGRAHGATLYVNLEPCCHFGRTPPCADALIAAGVREVVACMQDPDRRVNGRGFAALRSAGVRVRVGALRQQAERLNEHFLRYARSGAPFVTLKAGMSLDGRIATRGGESKWITSPPARAAARALRARHDAVVVGVNTVIVDDPRLSPAPAGGRHRKGGEARAPLKVVLDARLRTPSGSRLLRGPGEAMVLTLPGAPRARRRRLEKAGALVLEIPGRDGRIALRPALRELARRGVTSVLIEGGGEVLGSALDQRVGDRLVLFVAGKLLGGREARPAFAGDGVRHLGRAARIEDLEVRRLGPDLMLEGRLRFPGGGRGR